MSHHTDLLAHLAAARVSADALEAERARWQAAAQKPPVVVDPPPPPVAGGPDFSAYAFAHLMPTWRQHAKPTEADCDWIVADRAATSTKGLGILHADVDTADVVGHCLRESMRAGHGPRITFGIRGNGGAAHVGGWYGPHGGGEIAWARPDGTWVDLDVQFVGLTPDAELGLTWGGASWQEFGYTRRVAAFDLGIVGRPDTHAVTVNKRCGEIILDRFWLLRPLGAFVDWHAGLHLANWTRLALLGLEHRVRPGESALTTSGHTFYVKHSDVPGSETWVMDCDLSGGGQTGFQKRPGKDESYLTAAGRDVVVLANNRCNGHGWDRPNHVAASALSHWSSPHARVFIVGNDVLDARGGCLMVGGQPLYNGQDRNWYDAQGFPIGEVYIDGNRFANPRGDRPAVSISSAKRVYWGDKNQLDGRLEIQSEFISTRPPAMPRAQVSFMGDRSKMPAQVTTFDAATRTTRPMTVAEVDALHVPAWPVPVGL